MGLTQRQRTILNAVTARYIGTGAPVSSKEVANVTGLGVSSSTVRNEFALLEEQGYLTHPHTSAGRIPTDLGYREFVDQLISEMPARVDYGGRVAGGVVRSVLSEDLAGEIDTALRQVTEAMARATNLLALALSPRVSGARLCHVELLILHPEQLMYVFIISTGAVLKGVIDWSCAIDSGLVDWARTYLNESFSTVPLTARLVRKTLDNPELGPREAGFLRALSPAFERLIDEQQEAELYVGGASRLLSGVRSLDVGPLRGLLSLLEERYQLLQVLRSALSASSVVVRIGKEHESDALRPFSVVAASYGLPQRRLGTVSLVGPTRMDYRKAIATVCETASLLSDLIGERYE